MKSEEPEKNVVQLEFQEFLDLLVCRRPLKRVWPTGRHEAALRGTLRDPRTGAIYKAKARPAQPGPLFSKA